MRRAQAGPRPAPVPIVHRDLKPENVQGPPAYMAPEQLAPVVATLDELVRDDAPRLDREQRKGEDARLLEAVIAADAGEEDEPFGQRADASSNLMPGEREAFPDMLERVRDVRLLTPNQKGWVQRTAERLGVRLDVPDNGAVPRGREVATPQVLRALPLAPPGRRAAPAEPPRREPEEQRWGPSWGFRQPPEEQPCRCGGKGAGAGGFHYPGAPGCVLPPPPPWLEPFARILGLPLERVTEAYWQAQVLESNAVVLQIGYRQVKVFRTPDGNIDDCALAAGEAPSACSVCLHAEGGCPDGDRLHRAMAERFIASRPRPAEQLGLGFDAPRAPPPDPPRRAELERDVGRPLRDGDGIDFEDDIPF